METTSISPQQTAGEVIAKLVQAGARQIAQDYDANGKLTGVAFTMEIAPGMIRAYRMPVRTEPVFKLLNGRRKNSWDRRGKTDADREQAERVAWRQLYRWIEAQLAIIQVGMVASSEVFLPYMQDESGKTVYQMFMENTQKLLSAGEPE